MEDWNINDYQGKRKDQVEFSNTVTFFTVILGGVVGFIVGVLYLCNVL